MLRTLGPTLDYEGVLDESRGSHRLPALMLFQACFRGGFMTGRMTNNICQSNSPPSPAGLPGFTGNNACVFWTSTFETQSWWHKVILPDRDSLQPDKGNRIELGVSMCSC